MVSHPLPNHFFEGVNRPILADVVGCQWEKPAITSKPLKQGPHALLPKANSFTEIGIQNGLGPQRPGGYRRLVEHR